MSTTSASNSCVYCGKCYTRKTTCDKHILLCEVTYKSKRLKLCEEEETTNVPSVLQLYNIIQEMALKQQKMEEKMEEMQKWIDKKKKKLNVLHWLNSQFSPTSIFEVRAKSIVVIQEDISVLIEQNFSQTVTNILKRNLNPPKDQKSENKWTKITPDEFTYLLRVIHSKLLNALCTWRDLNNDRIKYNDKFAELYNKTVIKLMGVDFNQEATLSKIRTPLYTYLKGDLKNMVEYDYEF